MIGFNSHQKFYIYTQKVDMRKGVYGLCGIVRNELDEEPTNGCVYVFFAKSLRTIKLLVWDNDGFVIYGKWLSKGKYEDIKTLMDGKKHPINYEHLIMILSGVSLLGVKQRPRYKMK